MRRGIVRHRPSRERARYASTFVRVQRARFLRPLSRASRVRIASRRHARVIEKKLLVFFQQLVRPSFVDVRRAGDDGASRANGARWRREDVAGRSVNRRRLRPTD